MHDMQHEIAIRAVLTDDLWPLQLLIASCLFVNWIEMRWSALVFSLCVPIALLPDVYDLIKCSKSCQFTFKIKPFIQFLLFICFHSILKIHKKSATETHSIRRLFDLDHRLIKFLNISTPCNWLRLVHQPMCTNAVSFGAACVYVSSSLLYPPYGNT